MVKRDDNPDGLGDITLGDDEEEEKIPTYEDLVTKEPEQNINLEDYEVSKTVSEEDEETKSSSDIQAILDILTPKYKDPRLNEILKSAMVSRIFPDNLLDKNKLIVLSMLEEHEPDDSSIDVIGTISTVQDALSIGF